MSLKKQQEKGNGLEAQQKMIRDFVAANGGELVEIYIEAESGKRDDRPELAKALRHADLVGGRLLVGKLDRLSRSLHFLLSLQKDNVDFVVADMPHCDKFTVSIYGALAERERELIVSRTKAGMAAAKAKAEAAGKTNPFGTPVNLTADAATKGREMGRKVQADKAALFAAKLLPVVKELDAKGMSLNAIAKELRGRGYHTARGKDWSAAAVKNILARG